MVELLPDLSVSRETFERLESYNVHLKIWNKRINLVSSSTLQDSWQRHILDSAQLALLFKSKEKLIVDMGSGGGFPGLVLAILGYEGVTLLEADTRKCIFLREVARQTNTRVDIENSRIENYNITSNYVVSRALAPLATLFTLMTQLNKEPKTAYFFKGKSYEDEIREAKKGWGFECETYPNMINQEGVILKIENLHAYP